MTRTSGRYQSGREIFAEYIPGYQPPEAQCEEEEFDWKASDTTVSTLLSGLEHELRSIKSSRRKSGTKSINARRR